LSSDNSGVNPPTPSTTPPSSSTLSSAPAPAAHDENFPVASLLCPPHLRAPIAAIYGFARTADDMADEGDIPAQQRLDDLAAFRAELHNVTAGRPASGRWPQVFGPLAEMLPAFALPTARLEDLLDAFVQDVIKTRDQSGYATRAELLDYCRRSANPVGRLLLHLYGVHDARSLALSDAICSALQLINFWQDLSVDIPRGRHYLPAQDCAALQVSQADLQALRQTDNATRLIADQVQWARALMRQGSPLAKRIPGRAGWELRLVVQGGLRILDKIEAMNFRTLNARPRLTAWDAPLMLWRSLWM
jgi:squalene synthase HpnC